MPGWSSEPNPCPPSKAAPTQRAEMLPQVPHHHPAVGAQPPPIPQHTQGAGPTNGLLPVLQVLDTAETLEPPVHHDGQSGTQCLALLHAGKTGQASAGWHGGTVPGAVAGTGREPGYPGTVAPPPGMGEGNRGCPGFPLLPIPLPDTIPWHPKSPLPPMQHPRCPEASWAQLEAPPDLWDVRTTERPVLMTSRMRFQRKRRALGSIPVVGSSCGMDSTLRHASPWGNPATPSCPEPSSGHHPTPHDTHGGARVRQLTPRVISPP